MKLDRRSTGAPFNSEREAFKVSVQLEITGYVELGRKLATVEKSIIKLEDEWEAVGSLKSTERMEHRRAWENKKRRLHRERRELFARAAVVLS